MTERVGMVGPGSFSGTAGFYLKHHALQQSSLPRPRKMAVGSEGGLIGAVAMDDQAAENV